jgi:DNA end-binding protein Ku
MAPHANWKGFFAPFPRLLRYPYKVRNEDEYFDDIQDIKVIKDMLDLAKHIVEQRRGTG